MQRKRKRPLRRTVALPSSVHLYTLSGRLILPPVLLQRPSRGLMSVPQADKVLPHAWRGLPEICMYFLSQTVPSRFLADGRSPKLPSCFAQTCIGVPQVNSLPCKCMLSHSTRHACSRKIEFQGAIWQVNWVLHFPASKTTKLYRPS